MAGVAIATMAMVIVLSVFNGFSEFTATKISRFSAPLTVTPLSGKTILDADSLARAITAFEGVDGAWPMLTERAFAVAGDRQTPVILCGIDTEGATALSLPSVIIDGEPLLLEGDGAYSATAVSSVGVANALHAFPAVPVDVSIYEPRRNARINPANPMAAFRCDTVVVAGVYRVDQNEFDNEYLFVPLSFARQVLGYTNEATAIEVSANDSSQLGRIAREISSAIGPGYRVADRIEQQHDAFRMINVEKWITLVMLTFILIVATFNVLSIMSIMMIEKRGNSRILSALGATSATIRGIYGWLSMLITSTGGAIGIIIGVGLSLAQQYFGFIKLMADDTTQLSIDAYPVSVAPTDIIIVAAVILAVGFLTSLVTRFIFHTVTR